MNTTTAQAGHSRQKAGKIVMAIAVVSAMAGLVMTPAYGDEHANGHERHRARHYVRHDAQPFYAPAPVYYNAPQPSPGISLFVPIVIR